jgi:hypothetical protein
MGQFSGLGVASAGEVRGKVLVEEDFECGSGGAYYGELGFEGCPDPT